MLDLFSGVADGPAMMPSHPFTRRAAGIEPFKVVELLERARALERGGADVVHFEVGEPDFPSCSAIVDAGIRALQEGRTGYTEALGIPELRAAIAEHYRSRFDADVPAGRIVVTTGASAALQLLCVVLVEAGAGVLMTDPGYPCNATFVETVGGIAERVPVESSTGFQMTAAGANAAWGTSTAGMLLASPSNPTGAMLAAAEVPRLGALARDRGSFVIVDEIYQGLVYDGRDPDLLRGSVAALEPDFYVVNSFSKYFGMTGWRLGWMVVPERAVEVVARAAQNLYISPPAPAQYAALGAFSAAGYAEHERRRLEFQARRDLLLKGLDDLGLPVALVPNGAFYLYVDIGRVGVDAETFCWRLLEQHHVAVTPGTDFGRYRAEQFVRFAYTTSRDKIREGLDRLEAALGAGL